MLAAESGRRQVILTGMAIIGDGRTVTDVTRTDVEWRELTAEEARAYIAGGEGRGRAGGYSIAGQGSIFVKRIEGDFNSAIGLSTYRLAQRLPEFGFKVL
jgi:septum formation protein